MAYNWRNGLSDYAQNCGVLAGFCFTLIVFILGWNVSQQVIYGSTIQFGHVAVFLTGVASILYIAAADLFLTAKQYDLWSLPTDYRNELQKRLDDKWASTTEAAEKTSRTYERYGRLSYNAGLLLVFAGIAFVIAPYNLWLAIVVGGLGIFMQLWQFAITRLALQ